ncbi:MAG: zinc ribbon domain-containing protein [Faecousia sp.]
MIVFGVLFSLLGGAASVLGFLARSSDAYRQGESLRELPLIGGLLDSLGISTDFSHTLVNIVFFGGLFLFILGLVLILAGALAKSRKGGKTYTCSCGAKVPENSTFCLRCGKKLIDETPLPPTEPADGPRCPNCGTPIENESQRFCIGCGAVLTAEPEPKTEGPLCPNCGAPVDPKLPFCCNCGAYLEKPEAPVDEPEPEPEPEPEKLLCANCGAPIKSRDQRFCIACGTVLTAESVRKNPGKVCPNCGAVAPDLLQRFCVTCGAPFDVPEPELKYTPEPVPESEPVYAPEPEPVYTPEPEPVPEPVYTPEPEPVPEPVYTPEPEPAPAPFKSTFKKRS